ncbi:MAG: thiamine diphosphokinase [Bacillota bacterium]|nr:thiamine diphosphokinase [Bacillota bacterium]
MKRCVLVCNGAFNDLEFHKNLLKENDYIIAADGGANHCRKMGVTPHLLLGDFDSIHQETDDCFSKIPHLKVPSDKDFTDIVLGIEEGSKRGYSEILILGALGGKRIDMELSNLLLLSQYQESIEIVDETRRIRCIHEGESVSIHGWKNQYLSIIPLTPLVKTGPSQGLKYPLMGLAFSFGDTLGISNEINAEIAEVSVLEGKALLICQKK